MVNSLVLVGSDGQPERCPLLKYIQQRWSRLLAHERLDVELQVESHVADETPRVRWEIFVGDEFRYAGKLHVDVVVKPCDELSTLRTLPTVLVFEKHTPHLVQHELNSLRLETPVLARLAS